MEPLTLVHFSTHREQLLSDALGQLSGVRDKNVSG